MKFEVERRYIAKENRPLGYLMEVGVKEISPDGEYVKFRFPSGAESWERIDDWLIVEGLEGLKEE